MFDLKNRVALVTGSSRGIGKAVAIALGEAGAKVAVNYRERGATSQSI
jgi:NAD(P)-dependent dehydrogenase (short-subunit alcohol dehydrogenase family)